jgi:hypothetical protein
MGFAVKSAGPPAHALAGLMPSAGPRIARTRADLAT